MRKVGHKESWLSHIILAAVGLVFTIPFLWMIALSFDNAASVAIPFPPSLIPREFTLVNWKIALEKMHIIRVLLNTFQVEAGVILVSLAGTLLAGYSLSKLRFKGSRIVLFIFLATLMIPLEVRIAPLFKLFKDWRMINTYWCFWLPAVGNGYLIFLVKAYMDSLPDSLREAAKVDGAGEFWIFSRIFVPLSKNIVITVIILQFMATWNDLLWPLMVLFKPEKYIMQVQLISFRSIASSTTGDGGAIYPAMTMAGTIVSIVPMLLLFLILQRYIAQSVALSGIKQ